MTIKEDYLTEAALHPEGSNARKMLTWAALELEDRALQIAELTDTDNARTAECEQLRRAAAQAAAAPAPVEQPAPAVTHEVVTQVMMPATVRQAMAPKAETPPTLTLGEISTRLGFTLTADFLKVLGFEATTVKAAKLYHESQFAAICEAIKTHISEVQNQFEAVAA